MKEVLFVFYFADVSENVRRSTRANSKLREIPEESESSKKTRGKK